MTSKTEWINASRAPVPLASGQVLAPGERDAVDMTLDHNKGLRDDGSLIKADKAADKED